jgi:carnitine 3-dehydrogenase
MRASGYVSREPTVSPSDVSRVAALGGGLIGRSWAALFLAAGKDVAVFDPAPGAEARVRASVEEAWPVLRQLGLTDTDGPVAELTFCADARDAVDGASFVQESIPEKTALKHALYAEVEDALPPDAVVATSASGLTLGELQAGWRDPSRFVLGHPFNPPHLIPLVEVLGNDRTAPGVVDRARAFYGSVGKVTIEVKREVPGHVANRLQAALWREAIHLVNEGVASVEDIDKAVSSGPGQRWAAMGPTQLFHLGADDGLAQFCEHYADSFNRWWDDLGTPYLDDETVKRLVDGLTEITDTTTYDELAARRNTLVAAVVAATHPPTRLRPNAGAATRT